ncbi:hypothetical protein FBEOM_10011 [Fusarium beomiforme]|uniref:Uncharacterized protein n=1 Tax=Fusarium beomiforme TaxID=44412 RepID=A0A9P5AC92_9HYPO|nr:hypothetical protein FBEOM_10011 [Fusarium beomiforme]
MLNPDIQFVGPNNRALKKKTSSSKRAASIPVDTASKARSFGLSIKKKAAPTVKEWPVHEKGLHEASVNWSKAMVSLQAGSQKSSPAISDRSFHPGISNNQGNRR